MYFKRSHAEMVLVYRAVSTQKRLVCNQTKRERETRLSISAFSVKKSSRTQALP